MLDIRFSTDSFWTILIILMQKHSSFLLKIHTPWKKVSSYIWAWVLLFCELMIVMLLEQEVGGDFGVVV